MKGIEHQETNTIKAQGSEPILNQALVSLDLSSTDESVLEYFDFWAAHFPIRQITGLHIVPTFNFLRNVPGTELLGVESAINLNSQLQDKLKTQFFDFFENDHGSTVHFQVLEGNPLESLLEYAEEHEADLMVFGKKQVNQGQGILARNLIRKGSANALLIPEGAKETITKILVPVDFSETSGKALKAAIHLAETMDETPEIEVLYVFDSPDMSAYKTQLSPEKYRGMLTSYIQEALDNFLVKYADTEVQGITTKVVEKVRPGVARYIYQEALGKGQDLIVLGATGQSSVERMFLGSVSEKLLQINDSIPMLVIK